MSPAAGRPNIASVHALRFFAALAVVVHHSLTAFPPPLTRVSLGAAGVDVFFVISGLVIGLSDSTEGPLRFAIKRLIRVVPLYWLATLAYGLARYAMFGEVPETERILRSLFLIPDFSTTWAPVYYPGWTLGYELIFYALFGAALAWRPGHVKTLTMLATLALAAAEIPVPGVPGAVFATRPCIEFAAGLGLAMALPAGIGLGRLSGGLALLLAACLFAANAHGDDAQRVLVWGVPAALLVAGVMAFEPAGFWRHRLLRLGGDASYALYLVHLTAMEPLLYWLERQGMDLHSRLRWIALREAILVTAAIGAALLVHWIVEKPMLRVLRRALLPAPARA